MSAIGEVRISVIGGDPIRLMVECEQVRSLEELYRDFLATGSILIELLATIPVATKLRVTFHVNAQYREFPAAFIRIDDTQARIVPTMDVADFAELLQSVGANVAAVEPRSETVAQPGREVETTGEDNGDIYGLENDELDRAEPDEPTTGPVVTDASARLRDALKQRALRNRTGKPVRNFRRTPVERGGQRREAQGSDANTPSRGAEAVVAVREAASSAANADESAPDTGPVRVPLLRTNDQPAVGRQRPKLRARPETSDFEQADEPRPKAEVKRRPKIKARPDALFRDEEEALDEGLAGPGTGPVRILSESGEDPGNGESYKIAQLRTRIEFLADSIDRVTHFELLGIHWTAQTDEVATAVTGLRRVLASPDLKDADAELQRKAKQLLPQIERIKDLLMDKVQRQKYRKKIVSPFEVQMAVDLIKDSIETACYQNDTKKLGELFAQVLEVSPHHAKQIREQLRGRTFKK